MLLTNTNKIKNENKDLYIPKSIFDLISKNVYLDEGFLKKNKDLFNWIESFKFITSLQLSGLMSEGLNGDKNVIFSSILHIGEIDFNYQCGLLNKKIYSNDLYIINVSWVKTIDLVEEDKANIEKIPFTNIYGECYNMYVYQVSYTHFFKNFLYRGGLELTKLRSEKEKEKDSKYLGINPIIIFNGMYMGNIIKLFKLYNINLNGGSISRRHRLSLAEYKLSLFLDLFNLFDENKETFYNLYKEDLFSSKLYNRRNNEKLNPYISQYLFINGYYNTGIEKYNLESSISKLNEVITRLDKEINSLQSRIETNNLTISNNLNEISFLKSKNLNGISTKQKASLTGRIKKNRSEIDNIKYNNVKLEQEVTRLTRQLDKENINLNNLKSKLNGVINKISYYKSNITDLNNIYKSS